MIVLLIFIKDTNEVLLFVYTANPGCARPLFGFCYLPLVFKTIAASRFFIEVSYADIKKFSEEKGK